MKSLLLNLVIALSFLASAGSSFAQEAARRENAQSQPPALQPPVKNTYVEVMNLDEPILAIHYPWARHEKPSVEVRLLEETPESAGSRPLFFLTEYMKGTDLVAIYRCEQLSEQLSTSASFTGDAVDFVVAGRRNLLGRPSVLVRARSVESGPRYGTRAIFSMLDAWSIDGKLLYLELPQEDFGQPGRIEVIFYRGGDILWKETAEWPGYKTGRQGDQTRRQGEGETGRTEAKKVETKPPIAKKGA